LQKSGCSSFAKAAQRVEAVLTVCMPVAFCFHKLLDSQSGPDNRVWSPVNVRGTAMEKYPVFAVHGTQLALFRMASGCQIPGHHHSSWVQVAVVSGRMRVEQDGSPARIVPAGGIYFISPGEDHVETVEVETMCS
jgi:hypothetical protein